VCSRDIESEAQFENNLATVILNAPCILRLRYATCHCLFECVRQLDVLQEKERERGKEREQGIESEREKERKRPRERVRERNKERE